MAQEVNFLTGFVAAFKKSPTGLIIGLLVLYGVFSTTNWQNAEERLRQCNDNTVKREQAYSSEKALFLTEQNKQWFELGRLRAQFELKTIKK
jgi:hypothetical protein